MYHTHLKQCNSTQSSIKELITNQQSENRMYLVSTDLQTAGFGRRGNDWISTRESLAFSFTLQPSYSPSLTPLELAVLIAEFYKRHYKLDLKLKWPNDLILKGKKIGGILCENINGLILVGVGINYSPISFDQTRVIEIGYLKHDLEDALEKNYKERLPKNIYEFILQNRKSDDQIRTSWQGLCDHQNQTVSLDHQQGLFIGIGDNGQAKLKLNNGEYKDFYSGSLIY